jgi:hypothetical protein
MRRVNWRGPTRPGGKPPEQGRPHNAYRQAKKNNGAPGIDGVSFEDIEKAGVESFLTRIQDELVSREYAPTPNRKKEIPRDGGKKVRVLSIPTIRDRVVQGALLHILEPIFDSTRCFCYVRDWVEKKVRRHLARNSKRPGFGWKRWSTRYLTRNLGLYSDYRIRYGTPQKALPVQYVS